MRILVTGGKGMLGNSINKVFKNHNLIITDKNSLDVTNPKQVMSYLDKKIDLILHAAAQTDLTKAQSNSLETYKVNHLGTKNILRLAKKLNIPIVYIGSAMIFDGKKKSYTEISKAKPINHYGKSKLLGEKAIKSYPFHYIVRAGWGFGGGPNIDKKFINKIYAQIQNGATKLYGITDLLGNPTYMLDFAKTIKNIIEAKAPFGTYNSPGKGVASRFDFLKAFIDFLGKSKKIDVVPVTVRQYLKLFPSNFPYIKNEVLSGKKLEKLGLSAMREWKQALREYSKEFKS